MFFCVFRNSGIKGELVEYFVKYALVCHILKKHKSGQINILHNENYKTC